MTVAKKLAVGCLSVALVASLAIGGSLAFLTDSEERTNVFTVGDLDITLEEPNWDPDEGTDLTPGSTMMKDPVVTAVEHDSYMRVYASIIDDNDMMPNPAYVDEETTPGVAKEIANTNKGKVITDAARLALIKKTIYNDSRFVADTPSGAIDVSKKYSIAQLAGITSVNNGVNTSKFTADAAHSSTGVDCYTYNGVFHEEDTALLFTNIVIPTDWNQTQMAVLGKYKITIYAQAIQVDGFANAAEAFEALDGEVTAHTIQLNHGKVGA